MIVATAGHVDHGKTSLVRALTGTDTDRLPEEKKRGLTIDIGFAYLPSEEGSIGFVDVPGHERFVHNMLAGVAGIDLALLVVAADDGVMPQTREHLAILDLLGVSRGLVALTKIDRVPSERVVEVTRDLETLLAPTLLGGAPIFPVSSVRGDGLAALKDELLKRERQTQSRSTENNFRLSVDRCFTIAGAGLVVTGTAISGEIAVGSEVRALLAGANARVRAIHAQNAEAQRGRAGQRLALNLAGLEGKSAIHRGEWIVAGEVPPAVARFDARLRCVAEQPLKHWMSVHVHLGAADVTGRVAILEKGAIAPGDSALVQLVLDKPIGAVFGDGFIVRDQSSRHTLGGGRVIDVFPPPRGRARPERLAWLAGMETENAEKALEKLLELSPLGVDLARFAANRNLPAMSGWRFASVHWNALREKALASLSAWHARSPDAVGVPEARLLEGVRVPREAVTRLVDELVREGRVAREGANVRLTTHHAQLSPADAALWKTIAPVLRKAALRPPSLAELSAETRVPAQKLDAALSRLARQGLLVRISKTRFYLPAMIKKLEAMAQAQAEVDGQITAAGFRDRSGIGRNLSIEVLEYFDRIRLTRRIGDSRVLRADE